IWNVRTGQLEQTMSGHKAAIYGLDFSPDGKKVVSAAYDNWGAIWDVQSGKLDASLQHPQEARFAAWSPDGRTIATGCYDGAIRLWNPNGTLRSTVKGLGDEDTKVT